jgi:hypothetical protein
MNEKPFQPLHASEPNRSADPAPEPPGVSNAYVVLSGVGLVLLVAAGFGAAAWAYAGAEVRPADDGPATFALQGPNQAAPHLQVRPADELKRLRSKEESQLHSYGWIDREQGIVRIPIERAIDMLDERRLPARETNSDDKTPEAP